MGKCRKERNFKFQNSKIKGKILKRVDEGTDNGIHFKLFKSPPNPYNGQEVMISLISRLETTMLCFSPQNFSIRQEEFSFHLILFF